MEKLMIPDGKKESAFPEKGKKKKGKRKKKRMKTKALEGIMCV